MAFDTTEHMRHLAFFTALAELEEEDPSWRSVTAGLVVLRLVDSWIEDGSAVVSADSWGVRSVRAAIEDMPAGLPAKTILGGVVDALISSHGSDLHAIAPRLMAYARSLDLDAQWALASDVYETVLAHVHPVEDSDVVVNALLRRAYCLHQMGDLASAMVVLTAAAQVADQSGDMIGALRARIGEAKIIATRGNLPAADVILEETAARAAERELLEVRSTAMHDRSFIANMRKQYDVAIRFAYDALQDCESEPQRDRILNDLAGSFQMLGMKSAARDAYLILMSTAREQYQRWVATINLMELSAEEGARLQFERYRQSLESSKLPPMLQTQFELFVGRGFQTMNEFDAARPWLERAARTAEAHSFNQLLFESESALAAKPMERRPSAPAPVWVPEDVDAIANQLQERCRELNAV